MPVMSNGGAFTVSEQPEQIPQDQDSAAFLRCASCLHADHVDSQAGTLICGKHKMTIDAEAGEIPDDCPEHTPR